MTSDVAKLIILVTIKVLTSIGVNVWVEANFFVVKIACLAKLVQMHLTKKGGKLV